MSGHTLDLVITREVDELLSTTPVVDYLLSDHTTVICDLLIKKPSFTVKEISYRKIDGIDIESFSPSVRSSALIQDSPGNLEDLVNLYNTTLSKILDRQSNGSFKSSIYAPFTRVERTDLRSNRRKRSFPLKFNNALSTTFSVISVRYINPSRNKRDRRLETT